MKTNITKYILVFAIILSGFFSWLSIERAVNVSTSSTWLVPIICFSLFFVILSLSAVIVKDKKIVFSVLAVTLLSSLIFTFSFVHIVMLAVVFLFMTVAISKISNDSELNIKIDLRKSIQTGKIMLILALAIMASSQYYFETKDRPLMKIIPKFETKGITSRILPMIYPNLKSSAEDDLTVDEFLLQMSQENTDDVLTQFLDDSEMSQQNLNISKNQLEKISIANQEAILQEGRKNLEDIVGEDITGQEKISDVFSDMISARINEIFVSMATKENLPLISTIPALILFLTIVSLGPFLGFLAIYVAVLIFWIFKLTGLVKISKEMKEVEVVE